MAAQKFSGAVQHQISTQRQRVLVNGRGKRIIDDGDGPYPFSRSRQPVDVDNF